MRRFHIGLALRLTLLLAAMIGLSAVFWNPDYPFTQTILGILIVVLTFELIRFVRKTNTDLARFISALKFEDGSIRFGKGKTGSGFDELRQELERIVKVMESESLSSGQQDFIRNEILDLLPVGVIVLRDGQIHLRNAHAASLLTSHLSEARMLEWVNQLEPMQQAVSYGELELAVQKSTFQSEGNYQVYTLTEISQVSEAREMDAYLKLIRILTHEIMNSVTSISSLSSTLLDVSGKQDLDAQFREALGSIKNRSEGLLVFVDSYRKLTHVPAPSKSWFPLLPLVKDLALPFEQQNNLNVNISGDNTIQIHADREQVSQVIINVLLNAQHALEQQAAGTITINLTETGADVLLEISDNGPGIEPRDLNDIFTPFFSTREHGSGIGLSLSRQMMRNHQGSIGVRSKLGEGALFTLRFPKASQV